MSVQNTKKKVAMFGATGMVGRAILLKLLKSDGIESVTSVGRRALTSADFLAESGVKIPHPKLTQVVVDDVKDTADEVLAGKDAVVYAVGLSGGVPRGKLAWYEQFMGKQPVELARRALKANQNSESFVWTQVSATGADSTSRV